MTEQQQRKQHIRAFMQAHYTDERLAQLLAHAQDGKLVFASCCCFIGVTTADHALCGYEPSYSKIPHYVSATKLAGSAYAENAYSKLHESGPNLVFDPDMLSVNSVRRRVLIPIIRAEMRRRAKAQQPTEELAPPMVPIHTTEEMETVA